VLVRAREGVRHLGGGMFYWALHACGAAALRRAVQDAGLILCYHNVVADRDDARGDAALHLPFEDFKMQVRWLTDHYEVVPLRDWVARLKMGASLRSTAAVTFDDGYAGTFACAVPWLKQMGIPATVFVVADAPGRSSGFWWDHPAVLARRTDKRRTRWLTEMRGDAACILSDCDCAAPVEMPPMRRPAGWTTIREHAGHGIDIGAHSVTHRSLTQLSSGELEREVVGCRTAIHAATGIWTDAFAYPYGLWNGWTRDVVRAAGYRAAVALTGGLNSPACDPWCLRRVNIPAGIGESAFEAWASGFQPGVKAS
jgi:peptidoglycan/xylan/chitin deacetylase (PgdA/CDA1 family)